MTSFYARNRRRKKGACSEWFTRDSTRPGAQSDVHDYPVYIFCLFLLCCNFCFCSIGQWVNMATVFTRIFGCNCCEVFFAKVFGATSTRAYSDSVLCCVQARSTFCLKRTTWTPSRTRWSATSWSVTTMTWQWRRQAMTRCRLDWSQCVVMTHRMNCDWSSLEHSIERFAAVDGTLLSLITYTTAVNVEFDFLTIRWAHNCTRVIASGLLYMCVPDYVKYQGKACFV